MNRRRFISNSLSATIATSMAGSQAFGSVLSVLTQLNSDVLAMTGDGK